VLGALIRFSLQIGASRAIDAALIDAAFSAETESHLVRCAPARSLSDARWSFSVSIGHGKIPKRSPVAGQACVGVGCANSITRLKDADLQQDRVYARHTRLFGSDAG